MSPATQIPPEFGLDDASDSEANVIYSNIPGVILIADGIDSDDLGTPDDDILSGQIKRFSNIDDMLNSLKRPW